MLASIHGQEKGGSKIGYVDVAGKLDTTELPKVATTVDKVSMGLEQHQKAAPEHKLENCQHIPETIPTKNIAPMKQTTTSPRGPHCGVPSEVRTTNQKHHPCICMYPKQYTKHRPCSWHGSPASMYIPNTNTCTYSSSCVV